MIWHIDVGPTVRIGGLPQPAGRHRVTARFSELPPDHIARQSDFIAFHTTSSDCTEFHNPRLRFAFVACHGYGRAAG